MFDECFTATHRNVTLCRSAQCCKLWRKPSPAAGGYCEYCSSLQLTLDDRHNVHIPARHFSNPRNLFLPSCRALPLVCRVTCTAPHPWSRPRPRPCVGTGGVTHDTLGKGEPRNSQQGRWCGARCGLSCRDKVVQSKSLEF